MPAADRIGKNERSPKIQRWPGFCFRDPSGPEFFGDELLAACAEASDEFHDDFVNNGSAVMPAGITLEGRQAGPVDCLLLVVLQYEYPGRVGFEIGWTATPEETNRRIGTAVVPLDYLKQILQDGDATSSCECEQPGYFYSGVPGIIARVENGRLAEGASVERCDLCQRYASDEAALAKLRELGIA